MNPQAVEVKRANMLRIAQLALKNKTTTKSEIGSVLNLSLPTTLTAVRELLEQNILIETGLNASTGGRKAHVLAINSDLAYTIGVKISSDTICLVLTNLAGDTVKQKEVPLSYSGKDAYLLLLSDIIKNFVLDSGIDSGKIYGIGLVLPGIVDSASLRLVRSRELRDSDRDFSGLLKMLPWPIVLEREANAALLTELDSDTDQLLYLSLGNTLDGALYYEGHLYSGSNGCGCRFGHMIIKRGGRPCYCGKEGCAESYVAASVLEKASGCKLPVFFARLAEKDVTCGKLWNKYAESLAVTITNLHMVYDCDIILGGTVALYLPAYQADLLKNMKKYEKINTEHPYIRFAGIGKEAGACGISRKLAADTLASLISKL